MSTLENAALMESQTDGDFWLPSVAEIQQSELDLRHFWHWPAIRARRCTRRDMKIAAWAAQGVFI